MRIAILSDIHANLAALQAVLHAIQGADMLICLGDIVDYGPQPAECLDLIRDCAEIIVMGNHDFAVGNHADPGCSPSYRHLAETTRDFSIRALAPLQQRILRELPAHARFERGGTWFSAVHAMASNRLYGYMPPDASDTVWMNEVEFEQAPDVLMLGHTHLPLIKTVGHTTIVNPGSIGQPKDGDPRASYAVWEDGAVTLRRAEYDIDATAQAFVTTGLLGADIACLVAILRSGGAQGP